MSIGSRWYEENEEDIKDKRLQNIASLSLKQKMDEAYALASKRMMENKNAINKVTE